ncbi:hypothetical protein VaNZ11_009556 [Volvox africanus]|uniref:Uncharacterized protein n=1 Tax=Volvox africanus TaxID=51714 RepID=A0ABQ5S7Z8_9CHLO|nr:hypothetical protein VaNZ11_009556 [Volvox africanus]
MQQQQQQQQQQQHLSGLRTTRPLRGYRNCARTTIGMHHVITRHPPLNLSPFSECRAFGSGGGKGPEGFLKKLVEDAHRHAHRIIDCLTPKHEYDFADVTLIFISTMAFMWLAAGLYRVYAFSYYLTVSTP